MVRNYMKLIDIFEKQETPHDRIVKKYNLTDVSGSDSVGFDEEKGIWYGWSHRAIFGFKIGDKLFDSEFGDDSTHFSKHGKATIKTLADARKSAVAFSDYVS